MLSKNFKAFIERKTEIIFKRVVSVFEVDSPCIRLITLEATSYLASSIFGISEINNNQQGNNRK